MSTVEKGKHTPGPWRRSGGLTSNYAIIGVDNSVIAEKVSTHDARLIAAAPELLKALRAILETASLDPNHLHKFSKEYQQAKAAIAKAEGKDAMTTGQIEEAK